MKTRSLGQIAVQKIGKQIPIDKGSSETSRGVNVSLTKSGRGFWVLLENGTRVHFGMVGTNLVADLWVKSKEDTDGIDDDNIQGT